MARNCHAWKYTRLPVKADVMVGEGARNHVPLPGRDVSDAANASVAADLVQFAMVGFDGKQPGYFAGPERFPLTGRRAEVDAYLGVSAPGLTRRC